MSYAGVPPKRGKATQFASRSCLGYEVNALKTYRSPKRKEQLGMCSQRGFYVQERPLSRDDCYARRDAANPQTVAGPSRHWIKVKNPKSPAMTRVEEGNW
jgi:hypothetical protein